MTTPNNKLDRRVRIELLRAQAAVERQEMCVITHQIAASIQPEHIFSLLKGRLTRGIGSKFGSSSTGHLLDFILSFSHRYPLLLSGVSAVASTVVGKKTWRLGAVALTAWRLFGAYQTMQQRKKDRYIQANKPKSGRIIGPF